MDVKHLEDDKLSRSEDQRATEHTYLQLLQNKDLQIKLNFSKELRKALDWNNSQKEQYAQQLLEAIKYDINFVDSSITNNIVESKSVSINPPKLTEFLTQIGAEQKKKREQARADQKKQFIKYGVIVSVWFLAIGITIGNYVLPLLLSTHAQNPLGTDAHDPRLCHLDSEMEDVGLTLLKCYQHIRRQQV